MMRTVLLIGTFSCAILGLPLLRAQERAAPLPNAHAHNDYLHARPLLDALERGFLSVEADIHLSDGRLLVGHDRSDLRPERTLEALYLEPLRQRARANGGRIYRDGPEFTLLIDIKTDGEKTYAILRGVLEKFDELFTFVKDGRVETRAVRAVISGNRPRERIAGDSLRRAAIDGRLGDLPCGDPAHLVPLISDNWSLNFAWRGDGPMPAAERKKLRQVTDQAHAEGRRVRFWATPEKPALWDEILDAGVDLINTDDLDGLKEFLRARRGVEEGKGKGKGKEGKRAAF